MYSTNQVVDTWSLVEYQWSNDDIIWCCRHHVSSDKLSQAPMRFLPAVVASRLSTIGPRALVPLSSLAQQQKKEFMKSASFAQRDPWNMERT